MGAEMPWLLLFVAGLLEIVWAYTMKLSQGFTRPGPAVVSLFAMVASVVLPAASMKTLPLGTAYVVWTGIGAVGAFVIGIAVLGEALTAARMVAAGLIVVGLVLMRLATHE
jgi:quaternary ammonium compound-resistance protein SugE